MLQKTFRRIDRLNLREGTKYRLMIWLCGAFSGAVGGILWLVLRSWCLNTPAWLLCFIGYPVFFSWLAMLLYFCNHSFHNGRYIDRTGL